MMKGFGLSGVAGKSIISIHRGSVYLTLDTASLIKAIAAREDIQEITGVSNNAGRPCTGPSSCCLLLILLFGPGAGKDGGLNPRM